MTSGLRRGWQVATAVMLLISLLWAWQSLELSLFDRLGPGPGFFAFWLSLMGVVLSAVAFAGVTRQPREEGGEPLFPRGEGARRAAAIFVAIALAAAAIGTLGFEITVLLFAIALPVALGERRWWIVVPFALAGSFGVHYVFTTMLDVALPSGLLGG